LTACGAKPPITQIEIVRPVVPVSLQTCAGMPELPTGDYTQKDVALFIAELADAHGDCESKLGSVMDVIDGGSE